LKAGRGKRFSYTFYYPSPPPCEGVKLSKSTPRSLMAGFSSFPIHQSITALDNEAMDILTLPRDDKDAGDAGTVHVAFAEYLVRTRNTICGRHPIGVLLGALSVINEEKEISLKWVKYDHSSDCVTLEDSSVSYASAYVTF
jgi:MEMO1 family protein